MLKKTSKFTLADIQNFEGVDLQLRTYKIKTCRIPVANFNKFDWRNL